MPQHSAPRASSVPARMKRRPCGIRSSMGPMSGASTANGAMVTSRAIAAWIRAWLTEAVENRVRASGTVTKATPTLRAACCRGRLAGMGTDRGASMHVDGGELLNVSPVRTREPDEVCAQAVDLARSAAEEMAGAAAVGEHLGVEADGERVVTHFFTCLDPGYRGWRWAVTVARASRSRTVTVSETLLVPGPD